MPSRRAPTGLGGSGAGRPPGLGRCPGGGGGPVANWDTRPWSYGLDAPGPVGSSAVATGTGSVLRASYLLSAVTSMTTGS